MHCDMLVFYNTELERESIIYNLIEDGVIDYGVATEEDIDISRVDEYLPNAAFLAEPGWYLSWDDVADAGEGLEYTEKAFKRSADKMKEKYDKFAYYNVHI